MATKGSVLTWDDYPQPRLNQRNGKWQVEVSIPRPIRHLFGGKNPSKRLSTKTSDKAIAESRKLAITHDIYRMFDKAQEDDNAYEKIKTDALAAHYIKEYALALNYKKGDIPELNPDTPVNDIITMWNALEEHRYMVGNNIPSPDWLKEYMAKFKVHKDSNGKISSFEEWQPLPMSPNPKASFAHINFIRNYDLCRSFFEDLTVFTARKQGQPEPDYKNHDYSKGVGLLTDNPVKPDRTVRARRVKAMNLSSKKEEWLEYVNKTQEKVDTRRKLERTLNRFIRLVGDLVIADVRTHHLFTYLESIVDEDARANKKTPKSSLKNEKWAISTYFNWLVRQGIIIANPFKGEKVPSDLGVDPQSWLPYTKDDLKVLFNLDMPDQSRLVMQIMLMTGMRPDEAASLTWEQFNNTNYGFRYFALFDDTATQEVNVKNIGSERFVPLHPQLILPPKSEGYLFNFREAEGKRVTGMGQELRPVYERATDNPRKRSHSFRRTLKIMLRDAGVSKEINDAITGHGSGDTSGSSYGGVSVEKRYEALKQLDFSFIL